MQAPTQPQPAEGPRDDDAAAGTDAVANQGRSATDPAEGADDVSAPSEGSPAG